MVEWKKLEDCLDYEQPTPYLVKSTEYDDSYDTPVLTAGQTMLLGYTNETDGIYKASKEKPCIIFDDFTTSFHWVDFDFKVKSSAMKMLKPQKNINFRYVYYAMLGINFVPGGHQRHWISKYSQFEIPLPSSSEQQRIVEKLDAFTSSIENLKKQIARRRKQYDYYRDQLLDLEGKPGVEMKTLGEICEVTDYVANGSFATLRENVSYRQEPDYAILVRTTDLSNNFKGDKVYIDERAYTFLSKSSLFGGEIIINNIGAGVGQTFKCPYLKERMSLGPNSIMVKTPNNDFFYYYFNSIYGQNAMMKVVTPGAMPKFNKTGFKTITIPVPSLQKQQRIVSILDTFEASIQNLEAQLKQREKQYEYYRNKLLTFE